MQSIGKKKVKFITGKLVEMEVFEYDGGFIGRNKKGCEYALIDKPNEKYYIVGQKIGGTEMPYSYT